MYINKKDIYDILKEYINSKLSHKEFDWSFKKYGSFVYNSIEWNKVKKDTNLKDLIRHSKLIKDKDIKNEILKKMRAVLVTSYIPTFVLSTTLTFSQKQTITNEELIFIQIFNPIFTEIEEELMNSFKKEQSQTLITNLITKKILMRNKEGDIKIRPIKYKQFIDNNLIIINKKINKKIEVYTKYDNLQNKLVYLRDSEGFKISKYNLRDMGNILNIDYYSKFLKNIKFITNNEKEIVISSKIDPFKWDINRIGKKRGDYFMELTEISKDLNKFIPDKLCEFYRTTIKDMPDSFGKPLIKTNKGHIDKRFDLNNLNNLVAYGVITSFKKYKIKNAKYKKITDNEVETTIPITLNKYDNDYYSKINITINIKKLKEYTKWENGDLFNKYLNINIIENELELTETMDKYF